LIKGIGIDLIEISRIERIYAAYGNRFLAKILSRREGSRFASAAEPAIHLAGRFAAKEACLKALGTGWSGGVKWREVEVLSDSSGRPVIELQGRAMDAFGSMGAVSIHCSITHTRDVAQAVVVIE
jgi:holo-[acyl-carrier protein] synthase